MLRIAFVFQKDSHFKAVYETALRLVKQYQCSASFIGIDSTYSLEVNYKIKYLDKENLTCLRNYDYIVACLGGFLLNYVVRQLKTTNVKVISIFPGIVSHYQLDAFISRLNVDQVWLNSRADYELYSKICKFFKCKNNGFLYGMSWLDLNKCNSHLNKYISKQNAIFFEQTELLYSSEKKVRFKKVITSLINENPNIFFKYKVRNNSEDTYFIELRRYLNQHKNVKIISELTSTDILNAKYYLSIGSSALVEGIAYGKVSCLIDNRLLDYDSKEFYKNSNLELRSLSLIGVNNTINKNWQDKRISLPEEQVSLNIRKKTNFISIKKRHFNRIRLLIIKLSSFYPNILRLVFNTTKLRAIQKSLEYMSH